MGLSYQPANGASVKDSDHAPILGPNSAAAMVAAVDPKNVRRLLSILLLLDFSAIVNGQLFTLID